VSHSTLEIGEALAMGLRRSPSHPATRVRVAASHAAGEAGGEGTHRISSRGLIVVEPPQSEGCVLGRTESYLVVVVVTQYSVVGPSGRSGRSVQVKEGATRAQDSCGRQERRQ
jgi:hypothetical protein